MTAYIMYWHLIKGVALWLIMTVSGWLVTVAFYLQSGSPESIPHWYEHPAVVSAVIAGAVLLASKAYDHFRDWRKERDLEDEEDEKRIKSLTETLDGMTQTGWQDYLRESNRLHQQQLAFKDAEIMAKDIDGFRDRRVKHRAFDEIQRLHGRIRILEVLIAQCQNDAIEVPAFELRYQEQILDGVEEEVGLYKQTLRNNMIVASLSGAPEKEDQAK